jgi:transcriptional regulator with XRE-family HTH domain
VVAQLIYEARTTRGLTQKELADRIGTKQSAIARLEDADYDGHSLSMLQKIAGALNQRVEIKFSEIELETSVV